MPSRKRLRSVVHSLAHHAASSLSYLHPHLGHATEKAGRSEVEVDLLGNTVVPEGLKHTKPMELSLSALRERFAQMLASEQFNLGDLAESRLLFEFRADFSDYWPTKVNALLKPNAGKCVVSAVNLMGDSVIPNPDWQAKWAAER